MNKNIEDLPIAITYEIKPDFDDNLDEIIKIIKRMADKGDYQMAYDNCQRILVVGKHLKSQIKKDWKFNKPIKRNTKYYE